MNSIKPAIGRKVWAWGVPGVMYSPVQPFDASIVYVWSDNYVNISYVDHAGAIHSATSVPLRDAIATDHHDVERVVTWMPYQTGQALAQRAETPQPTSDHQ